MCRFKTQILISSALHDPVHSLSIICGYILSVCRKVLFIGDPFQLPPVRGEGYFMQIAPRAVLTVSM